ncbi:MAG: hypothetical protein V4637_15615 [Pseudomonadota bacterium]
MLTSTSRRFTYLLAFLYALLGALLFFAPAQSSSLFAWKVSPFVTMTIGAWCLGNAWLAWATAKRWDWQHVRTALYYLWFFGLLETAVLVIFREKLQVVHPIAWLYVVTLIVNALAAVWGISVALRSRSSIESAGERPTLIMRIIIVAYVVFVAALGVFGAMRGLNGRGTTGAVFPEAMSAFSLSSFAAFYFALSLSALPLLWTRERGTLYHHGYASYGLVFIITAATFVYLDRFDFTARPLGLIYVGAYLLIGLITTYYLLKYRGGEKARLSGGST